MPRRPWRRCVALALASWGVVSAPLHPARADEADDEAEALVEAELREAKQERIPELEGWDPAVGLADGAALKVVAEREARAHGEHLRFCRECVASVASLGARATCVFPYDKAVTVAALPACALAFNRASFEALPQIVRHGAKVAQPHLDRCLLVAMLLERHDEPTHEVKLGAACGRLCHAWGRLLEGKLIASARVVAAAQALWVSPTPVPVARPSWAAFLSSALWAGAVQPDLELGAWAEGEATRFASPQPEEPMSKRLLILRDLAQGVRLAAYEDKAAAGLLAKALPPLAARDALPEDDLLVVGLYNHAVTAARRLKVGAKIPYRTSTQNVSTLLSFELPRGLGWTHKPREGDQMLGSWSRGKRILDDITLTVWCYSTSIDYVDDEGKVIGGDNIGGRLKKEFKEDRALLAKVRKASPSTGRISRALPDSRGYEIRGTDADETEVWYREWFFRSSVTNKHVVNVSLRREGIALDDDPELEAIVESMQEPAATGR